MITWITCNLQRTASWKDHCNQIFRIFLGKMIVKAQNFGHLSSAWDSEFWSVLELENLIIPEAQQTVSHRKHMQSNHQHTLRPFILSRLFVKGFESTSTIFYWFELVEKYFVDSGKTYEKWWKWNKYFLVNIDWIWWNKQSLNLPNPLFYLTKKDI